LIHILSMSIFLRHRVWTNVFFHLRMICIFLNLVMGYWSILCCSSNQSHQCNLFMVLIDTYQDMRNFIDVHGHWKKHQNYYYLFLVKNHQWLLDNLHNVIRTYNDAFLKLSKWSYHHSLFLQVLYQAISSFNRLWLHMFDHPRI